MDKLAVVQYHFRFLLKRGLYVFDKAIMQIPADHLAFRPTSENMSAKELAYHVYQVLYLLTRAAYTGRMNPADLAALPLDPEAAQTPEALIAFGRAVKEEVRAMLAELSSNHMEQTIRNGPRTTGFEHLMLAVEEALHHRGQLMLYLR